MTLKLIQCARCKKGLPPQTEFVKLDSGKDVCMDCWKEILKEQERHPFPRNRPLF